MNNQRTVKTVDFAEALKREGLLVYFHDAGGANDEIKGVTYNSKEVKEGWLFVVKGAHFKEQYLRDALDSGAACFVREAS